MTFNEIVWAIQDRAASQGRWLTLEQAKKAAANEILAGFGNLNAAREWLETFRDRWPGPPTLFTGYGYEVSCPALEAAIKYQEDANA